jgi:glycosyltransferase involved in cell wall biosynthesis
VRAFRLEPARDIVTIPLEIPAGRPAFYVSVRSEKSDRSSAQKPSLGLAVVIRAFEDGGAQRDMVLLCNALAAKGVRVTVLAVQTYGPLRSLLDSAVDVIEVPGRQMCYAIPGLRRLIRTVAPLLVTSSEAGLNLCALVAIRTLPRRNRPKLVLREVGSPSFPQQHDPFLQNRIAYRFLRRVYAYADRIVTLTEGARRDLTQNFAVPAEKLSVMLTNAVIPQAAAERLARWDGENGREDDLIVCVGRLSPEKDQRTLLRAVSLLPASHAWRLAIVGDGVERAALEACACGLGIADRVSFAGQVADPFAWMMRARVAVCSSIYEGLGNAIIEALACGTPVVSTDCSYRPFEILHGGRYGTLTPVGEAIALAAGIEAAMLNVPDRSALRARGPQYTAARAAERFLEIVADFQPLAAATDGPLAIARAS